MMPRVGITESNKAKKELNFYELIELLFKEADLIPLQVRLLCQKKIIRQQRKLTAKLQANLFVMWDVYKKKEMSTMELLENCADLYSEHNAYICYPDADDEKCEVSSDSDSQSD